MTNQEAIEYLNTLYMAFAVFPNQQISLGDVDKMKESVSIAIKALEQEPKTGHWIEIAQYSDGNHKIECSECKSHIFDRGHANSFNVKNKYKFCPNCSAKMESEEI